MTNNNAAVLLRNPCLERQRASVLVAEEANRSSSIPLSEGIIDGGEEGGKLKKSRFLLELGGRTYACRNAASFFRALPLLFLGAATKTSTYYIKVSYTLL